MSEDLISKEKAYKVLTEYYHHKTELQHKALREALDMVPSADIDLSGYSDRLWRNAYEQGKADAEAERKTGKWVDYPIVDGCLQCSVCGILRFDEANYCPNCGADMRGEADE